MSLVLYYHPLASFCHKVLIALYENGTPFEARIVDLMDDAAAAQFLDLWPVGKIPVLRDEARDRTVPETTIIIEYLERHYPGAQPLLPQDEDSRIDARLWDRFFDLYVQVPMQKIVTDRLRAEGERDARGVADAEAGLLVAYGMLEQRMAGREWAAGDSFGLADCAAAPALFYAQIVAPLAAAHPSAAGYFERLLQRPSVTRTIAEARPYFHMFPLKERIGARFLSDEGFPGMNAPKKKRVGILISGRGSNMVSLIAAARAPDYPAEIACVLSNRPDAAGLAKAHAEGVPARAIDHTAFANRAAFEEELDAALRSFGVELVAGAGFLRLLTPAFVARWRDRMLNIHPSLLPAFPGLNTHERALAAGVKIAGCTVHVVRPDMDDGPIIAQGAVPVLDGDSADTLAARVLAVEHRLYPRALALFASGGISISDEKVSGPQVPVNQEEVLIWPPLG